MYKCNSTAVAGNPQEVSGSGTNSIYGNIEPEEYCSFSKKRTAKRRALPYGFRSSYQLRDELQ